MTHMAHRIEVGFKQGLQDALGERIAKRVAEELGISVESVRTIDVFTIDEKLDAGELQFLAKEVFADAIVNDCAVDRPLAQASEFDFAVEVGFKPGVTDNVGATAAEAIEDGLKRKLGGGVYSSKQFLLKGVGGGEAAEIAKGLLANELIEQWRVKSAFEWSEETGFEAFTPAVKISGSAHEVQNIAVSGAGAQQLMQISKQRLLALSEEELTAVKQYFGRPEVMQARRAAGLGKEPTDAELEAIAQTWSEHCKHKIFNALIEYEDGESEETKKINSLFQTFVRGATQQINAPFLVSVFVDNAGIIEFDEQWNFAIKVETHNSPSALDPYGGALTGIVGVNRDVLGAGLGAKLLFNTDVFCFAPPAAAMPAGVLSPKRIFEGVRKGVQDGGNKSGVPTVNGCVVFHEGFACRPLVYCGTAGLLPKSAGGRPAHEKSIRVGDLIVMVGGRIGKDGIHGATFSSMQLDESSPVSAVQLGDPITQKKMADFLLEARDEGCYTAVTDNGAGGLSSSVGEMAVLTGGFELHLDRPPLKYPGLQPWEILVSESQERMTVAVPPEKLAQLKKLAIKHGVEASVVGTFTSSGKFHCLHNGRTVAFLDMDFLHEGVPQMRLRAKWSKPAGHEPVVFEPRDCGEALQKMLARPNVCSKEYFVRQYDHEVQGGSVIKPLTGQYNDGPSDAAVVRPLLESLEGIAVSNGICPKYSAIDAYWMAANAVDEALRNYVSVGGSLERVAGLDNFSWCDPLPAENNADAEYKLAQLVRACEGLYDACVAYGMPLVSGKDSMKNDFIAPDGGRHAIPPTLLVTAIGKMADVRKAVTMDAKTAGDIVYVLGTTKNELGGSEYYAMHSAIGSSAPKIDFEANKKLYAALSSAISSGLVASCHDCSDGGLGVALAETAFAGGLGMKVDLRKVPRAGDVVRDDFLLFSESAGRFVATVKPAHAREFEEVMGESVFSKIGETTADKKLVATGLAGVKVVDEDVRGLKSAWQSTLGV